MIRVDHLHLHYLCALEPTLHDVSFTVAAGELVVLCGPTGCGKSSLLNCLNGTLHHESSARISGRVELAGQAVEGLSVPEICQIAGAVFQSPSSQISAATPEAEIAFGLENQNLDRALMHQRITAALAATGLEKCRHQATATLSGGQQQRLIIACALALEPRILLLDEPISQLDPQGAADILTLLHDLKSQRRMAIVLVEHRLEEVLPIADRVLLLDQGRLVADLAREALLADLSPLRRLGLNLPHLPDLFEQLGRPERPLAAAAAPELTPCHQPATPPAPGREPLVTLNTIRFGYRRRGPALMTELSLELHRGERIALLGSNGAGKSTLLQLVAGALKPWGGTLRWHGEPPRIGYVLQNPDLMLFCESVREEVAFAPRHAGLPRQQAETLVEGSLTQLGIGELAERPPFTLSRGQRLRTAVASIISHQPRVLLLDEPTSGQDREQIDRLMTGIEAAYDLVLFATHDVDMAARHGTRIIVLHDGSIVADGEPHEVLADHQALATAAVRLTSLQEYAYRLGVRAYTVARMREALAP